MPLDCKNITTIKRHLQADSSLLMGDQITGGSATKTGGTWAGSDGTGSGTSLSDAELAQNQVAAQVFGIDLNMEQMFPIGTVLGPGDFVVEDGFTANAEGVDVIHQGMGAEARVYAPGTELKVGDLIINGKITDGTGQEKYAPYTVSDTNSSVSSDGAVVSPSGEDDDDAYCSLQELAGTSPPGQTRLEDMLDELDLELDIPGLDMSWWVDIQKRINELMQLTGKFIAKTQNLVALVDMDPDKACELLPDVSKLIEIMQRVVAAIARINAVMAKISKIIKKMKKALKLLMWLFAPLKAVQVLLLALQMIMGIPALIEMAVKSMTDASKILPQLIALLQKIISQCAMNRGAAAGLNKEECEALGGVYVDRRLGDLGDASNAGGDGSGSGGDGSGSGGGLPNLDANLAPDLGFPDMGNDYFPPAMALNAGDELSSGQAIGPGGSTLTAPAVIPYDANEGDWSVGGEGGMGNSDNADLNEDQIDAMLDSQILDLSECLTELDDFTKTANYS
jgi:hypothetical protein